MAVAFGFVVLCLLATFPGWHQEIDEDGSEKDVRRFPNRFLSKLACGLSAVTAFLALISSLWQHTAAVAAATTAENMGYGFVKSTVGGAAMGLGWAAFTTLVLPFVGLIIVFVSMRQLDEMIDDYVG